jgi:TRAP-type C4-dicarboxylate transport system permease small subunit
MAGFLTGAMAVLVFLQVLFRYVLDAPLDWSEEMSTFAFAWMCLLGASVGLRYDQHPRLDILLILFPPLIQKSVRALINFSIIFMLVVLLVYGVKLTMTMKMQKTAALGYSVSFVYVVLPLAAMIMLVHMIVQTMVLFRKRPERT